MQNRVSSDILINQYIRLFVTFLGPKAIFLQLDIPKIIFYPGASVHDHPGAFGYFSLGVQLFLLRTATREKLKVRHALLERKGATKSQFLIRILFITCYIASYNTICSDTENVATQRRMKLKSPIFPKMQDVGGPVQMKLFHLI